MDAELGRVQYAGTADVVLRSTRAACSAHENRDFEMVPVFGTTATTAAAAAEDTVQPADADRGQN